VQSDTLTPVWNEIWNVKNVPATAALFVRVMDKDSDAPTDDYIGKFDTTIQPGTKEVTIEGPLIRRPRGSFFLKVCDFHPVRFCQHCLFLVDRLIRSVSKIVPSKRRKRSPMTSKMLKAP
jgi:hypothetical protein